MFAGARGASISTLSRSLAYTSSLGISLSAFSLSVPVRPNTLAASRRISS
jgi:hypothetical protein